MASDAYLRSQYEALLKENKLLKQNVDVLDRENYDLKRSVYELSLKVDAVQNALLKVTGRLGGKAATSVSSGNGTNVTHVPRIASDALEPFQVKNLLTSNPLATENSPSTLFLEEDSDAARKKQQIGKEEQDELGDDRVFFAKSELRAHTGAVYTAKFSPSGRILASGSLDCKIMLWDLTTKANQQQIASLTQHQQLVIDVSWSDDSSKLVSASYDHTIKLWDVEKAEQITSYNIEGLVQCVSMKSTDDGHFLCGTSKNTIHECDTRSDNITRAWKNDAMINTIYSSFCGQYFITGDSKGMIKTWDVRMDSCIEDLTRVNDSDNHAISHIHVSPSGLDSQGNDEDGRFLAVNSYDNILRVYDRRFKLISSSHGQDQLQLSYVLTGHRNKNWPIKSAFFRGEGYKYKLNLPHSHHSQRKIDSDAESYQDRYEILTKVDKKLPFYFLSGHVEAAQERMLLATGSADNKIYIHDVSVKHPNAKPTPFLLQRLDAHSDRVYCVDFHPAEPILASASADSTIKIWLPKVTTRRVRK